MALNTQTIQAQDMPLETNATQTVDGPQYNAPVINELKLKKRLCQCVSSDSEAFFVHVARSDEERLERLTV